MTLISTISIIQLDKTKINTSLEHTNINSTIEIPIHNQKVITLGRHTSCHIQFNSFVISQIHATIWSIQFENDSIPIVYLHDNSRNGIIHKGEELKKGTTVILQHGDLIEFKLVAKLKFTCFFEMNGEVDTIGDWSVTNQLIGSGSFGSVFVAHRQGCKKLFAVKVIPSQSYIPDKLIKHESELLLNINHPNIVKVHDTFTSSSNIYIFEDLICGGDLFSYLRQGKYLRSLPEQETIIIVYQLLKVISYLHTDLQIVHRDLKLDNILLELPIPCSRIFVCDFGIAKCVNSQLTDTCVGTIEYSAPEVFNELGYSFKCDLWSLGVIIHILVSGISPFYGNGDKEIMFNEARNGRVNFNRNQFKNVSSNCKSFIKGLLKVNPEQRMSIDDCFNHDWIRINQVQLEKFYQKKIGSIKY